MWERWEAMCRGESMNVDWILANTKTCSKCFKAIEKNGGCNHVRCKCGQCLCWLCGAATGSAHDWSSIEGHSCNRFNDTEKKKVDDAKRKVLRYTHNYERYKAHGDSRRAELDKLGPAVEALMRRLREDPDLTPGSRNAAEALAGAHRALLASRHVLSRSYAFAYHMFGGEERTWATPVSEVATAQEMAERHVEKLSRLLALDVPAMPEDALWRTKQDAVTLTAVVEKHCGEMHKCIQDELLPMLVEPMSIAAYRRDGPIKDKDFMPCAAAIN